MYCLRLPSYCICSFRAEIQIQPRIIYLSVLCLGSVTNTLRNRQKSVPKRYSSRYRTDLPPPQCIIHVLPSCSQDFWRGVNCVDMSSRPNYTTAVMISFPCIFPSGASRSMLKSYSASISSPWGQWLMAVTTRSMVEAFSGAS